MLNPVSYPAAPPSYPVGGYGGYGKSPAYQDPQVAKTIARLRTKINALADKESGSLLHADMKIVAKRILGQSVANDVNIQALYQGGTTVTRKSGNVNYGSPFYSWFINACATRLTNALIWNYRNEIFHGNLMTKVNECANSATAKGNDPDAAVKRRFAGVIKNWYLLRRLSILEQARQMSLTDLTSTTGVQGDYNLAMEAKRASQSNPQINTVGKYVKAKNIAVQIEQYSVPRITPFINRGIQSVGLIPVPAPDVSSSSASSSSSISTPLPTRT